MDDLLPNQPEQKSDNAISEADEAPSRRPNRSNAGGSGTKPDDPAADPEFVEFWMHYPRKVGKPRALKAFRSARRRAQHATILAGLRAYAFSGDPTFVPHPSTWLNDDRWEIEEPPAPDEWGADAWIAANPQPPPDPPRPEGVMTWEQHEKMPHGKARDDAGREISRLTKSWLAACRPAYTSIWDWSGDDGGAPATVRDICEAAGLPPSWRGDKTWIAEICADRFEINNVLDVLRELSNASPQAVTSLRYWDSAIRQRCLRWDPERCDWWAPERKQRAAA